MLGKPPLGKPPDLKVRKAGQAAASEALVWERMNLDGTVLCSEHWPAAASLAHLVTGCEAGQVRQDLQNVNTAKLAVVIPDILIGLLFSKCHGCSASGVDSGPGKDGMD